MVSSLVMVSSAREVPHRSDRTASCQSYDSFATLRPPGVCVVCPRRKASQESPSEMPKSLGLLYVSVVSITFSHRRHRRGRRGLPKTLPPVLYFVRQSP